MFNQEPHWNSDFMFNLDDDFEINLDEFSLEFETDDDKLDFDDE